MRTPIHEHFIMILLFVLFMVLDDMNFIRLIMMFMIMLLIMMVLAKTTIIKKPPNSAIKPDSIKSGWNELGAIRLV